MSEGSENIVKLVCIIFGFILGAMIGSQMTAEAFLQGEEVRSWNWLLFGFFGMFGGWLLSAFIRNQNN